MKKQNNINEIEPILMVSSTASILFMASKIYNEYLSKMARACKAHVGSAGTICRLNYKRNGSLILIKNLNNGKSKCTKTKNPEKCIAKIQAKITKEKLKIKNYNKQLKTLSRYKLKDGIDMTNDINNLRQSLYEHATILNENKILKSIMQKVNDNGIGIISPIFKLLAKGTAIGGLAAILKAATSVFSKADFRFDMSLMNSFYKSMFFWNEGNMAPKELFEIAKVYLTDFWKLFKHYLSGENITEAVLVGLIVTSITVVSIIVNKNLKNRSKEVESKILKGSEKLNPSQQKTLKGALKINTDLLKKYKI